MSTGRRSNEKCSVVILGTPYRESSKNDIRVHVSSLFRFTYRKDFPTLNPYPISSDAGWGCMLRSAQMLMACALQRHLLGRDWRKSDKISVLRATNHYCDILKLFSDYPGPPHVYSIHHLVQCGMRYDKLPGEWFGPSTAALVLRDLTKLHRRNYGGTLEILVTQGDTIYVRDCEDLCALKTTSTSDKKEEATDAKEKVTINGTASGNHMNGSNGGVENGIRTGHTEDNTLNSISEDDTIFSNCTEDIHTTVAADFIRSHSDKTIDNATDPTLLRTKTANTISDAKNGKNGENGEKETSTKSQSVTSTPQHSVSMSNSTRPIFDPLFNPPPSHTAPWACSLVVCIPLRLGITSVSPEYIEVGNPYILCCATLYYTILYYTILNHSFNLSILYYSDLFHCTVQPATSQSNTVQIDEYGAPLCYATMIILTNYQKHKIIERTNVITR